MSERILRVVRKYESTLLDFEQLGIAIHYRDVIVFSLPYSRKLCGLLVDNISYMQGLSLILHIFGGYCH